MRTTTILKLAICACALLILQSCAKDKIVNSFDKTASFDSKIARDWFALQSDLIKNTSGFSGPVAARSFGYAGITLYQALYQGMPGYNSLEGKIEGLKPNSITSVSDRTKYHWAAVANAAMAEFFRLQFKTTSVENLDRINELELYYKDIYTKLTNPDIIDASVQYGRTLALEMNQYAISDGQSEAYNTNYPAYIPASGAGKWVPAGKEKTPLQPYWGSTRSFLTGNIVAGKTPEPPVYSEEKSSQLYKEAYELFTIRENITTYQSDIAKFWDDATGKSSGTAGHIFFIAGTVLESQRSNLAKAAEVYCRLGIALHDACIAGWKTKFQYNTLSPVTFIRKQIDGDFTPVLPPPPYPEYSSAHSVLAGAGFTVLSEYLGSSYSFADYSNYKRADINGSPKNFSSFMEAAAEAGASRLYGGVNFRSSVDKGLEQGIRIGGNTSKFSLKQ